MGTSVKVLHLIDSAGVYGAEAVVLALLENLGAHSIQGMLGCFGTPQGGPGELEAEARRRGLEVVALPIERGIDRRGMARVIEFARQNSVDILHAHGYKPDILLALTRSAGFRSLATAHGWSARPGDLRGAVYRALDSLALRAMDRVVAVSQYVRSDLIRRGVSAGKIITIHNGIVIDEMPTDHVDARARFGVPKEAFVIGAVGRLEEVKGYRYLIEGVASVGSALGDWRLLIAGEGQLRGELESLAASHGLADRIKLIGFQAPISRFLSMIDVFAMPSLSEGLPIALLEAMSQQRPVVCSRVGGMREVVQDRESGLLVSSGDPAAIAEALELIHRDRNLRSKLAANAKALVIERFSARSMALRYAQTYRDLVSGQQ